MKKTKITILLALVVILFASMTMTTSRADVPTYRYTGTSESGHTYNGVGVAKFVMTDGDPAFTVSATDRHGVMIGASRGRNPENPSDRSRGIYVEQTFEPAPDGLANTISTVQKDNLLAIRETEDGFHLARNDEKKSSVQGTHVTYPEGKSHCLSTAHVPMTTENLRIRRLTPRECWRLQGFPDWAFDRAKESGVSDTQLYRQAGNSVTVNVVYEIAKRFGD